MIRLSGWVREQNDAGIYFPTITQDISRNIAHVRLPKLKERANRVLMLIARNWPSLDDWHDPQELVSCLELQGRSYSGSNVQAMNLIFILIEHGHLRKDRAGHVGLSTSGLLAAEALGSSSPDSAQGFVAMSFDEDLNEVWTSGFYPAIRAAGFRPFRVNKKDYVGGISDEIIAGIRQSRFVVADYTQQKNGVYFEAGFAMGMGLTVIPTCRADEVDKLHFDIKHLNTLLWTNSAELVRGLSKRIIAVIGKGPNFSEEQFKQLSAANAEREP